MVAVLVLVLAVVVVVVGEGVVVIGGVLVLMDVHRCSCSNRAAFCYYVSLILCIICLFFTGCGDAHNNIPSPILAQDLERRYRSSTLAQRPRCHSTLAVQLIGCCRASRV